MKLFAIRDQVNNPGTDLGYLIYYPKKKQFFIELSENVPAEDLPILLSQMRSKGILSLGSELSLAWVSNRIIPYGRQMLPRILEDNSMEEYDEYQLLTLVNGRCEQDDIFLRPTRESLLPSQIQVRLQHKLKEVMPLPYTREILAVFRDETVRRIDLTEWMTTPELKPVCDKEALFQTIRTETGGNGVTWGRGKTIGVQTLYEAGETLHLTGEELDYIGFFRLADTADACAILGCTRQYMDQLVKKGRLRVHRTSSGRMLFRRYEIEQLLE